MRVVVVDNRYYQPVVSCQGGTVELSLGRLCGNDQLHRVINITGGLQETDTQGDEMCEIAISSYKQIGGNKSARLVGKLERSWRKQN